MWNVGGGFMAIWSDVVSADLDFYQDWLLKEHFPERVSIPGFISARVFSREIGAGRQFFIIYETASPQVLASPAYVARLNDPTEKSRSVMPRLKNFVRGAGRVIESRGVCGGGAVRVIRFADRRPQLNEGITQENLFKSIGELDRVLAVRLFEVDKAATAIQTHEKKIRTSKEETFDQLLVVEAGDVSALDAVSEILNNKMFSTNNPRQLFDHLYLLVAELQSRSLSAQ